MFHILMFSLFRVMHFGDLSETYLRIRAKNKLIANSRSPFCLIPAKWRNLMIGRLVTILSKLCYLSVVRTRVRNYDWSFSGNSWERTSDCFSDFLHMRYRKRTLLNILWYGQLCQSEFPNFHIFHMVSCARVNLNYRLLPSYIAHQTH